MSRIYFHSRYDTAEISGSERAYMGCLISDVMLGVLGNLKYAEKWIKPLFPSTHYLQRETGDTFTKLCATTLAVGHDPLKLPTGIVVDPWKLQLNTALAIGGDELRLFARLHGQCELHCWIDGAEDKHWIAGIIERGLEKHIMRKSHGWTELVEFLRDDNDSPIVCSFSVCEQFPNSFCLPESFKDGDHQKAQERFEELDTETAWDLCMQGLRENNGGLQLTKSNWDTIRFGNGITAFDLIDLCAIY